MRQIDETFRNSEAETASETEKSFFQNFFGALQGFVVLILIVTALVAVCIVFIAANTASMAVRERHARDRDAEGDRLPRRLLFGTLLGRGALLATLAGAAGALASLGAHRGCCATPPALESAMGPLARLHRHQRDPGGGRCSWRSSSACCRASVPSFGAARRSVVADAARGVLELALPLALPARNLRRAAALRTALTARPWWRWS